MAQYLTVVYESTDECMCACPFCEGKASLGFNDVKGLWICFKCGEKGSAKTLVEKLEGKYTEPEVDLVEISDELRLLERDVQQVQSSLPEAYLRRFHQPGRVHQIWRDRGFEVSVSDRWELGYDFLTGRLAIPFRDPFTGRLAGVIFRATDGSLPRYQYPRGFARRSSLYGSWFGVDSEIKHAVLVEGPTDTVNVGRAATDSRSLLPLGQYGSSISAGQVRLLHRLGITSATLFYDYDRAGLHAAEQAQEAAGSTLLLDKVVWDKKRYCWHSKEECRCLRIHQPDPGSLRVKEIRQMLERTIET